MAADRDRVLEFLGNKTAFHRRWRRNTMLGHTTSAVASAACSLGAAVTAGMALNQTAAVLAASATFLIVVEKGLLLREKWRVHLVSESRLENVVARLEADTIDADTAIAAATRINTDYAESLPIASREDAVPKV